MNMEYDYKGDRKLYIFLFVLSVVTLVSDFLFSFFFTMKFLNYPFLFTVLIIFNFLLAELFLAKKMMDYAYKIAELNKQIKGEQNGI